MTLNRTLGAGGSSVGMSMGLGSARLAASLTDSETHNFDVWIDGHPPAGNGAMRSIRIASASRLAGSFYEDRNYE